MNSAYWRSSLAHYSFPVRTADTKGVSLRMKALAPEYEAFGARGVDEEMGEELAFKPLGN